MRADARFCKIARHVTLEGMVVDSIWLPIGTLLFLLGLLVLIVSGILCFANLPRLCYNSPLTT